MWSKLFGSFLAANIVTDRFTFIKIVFHTTVAHHPGITKETVGEDDVGANDLVGHALGDILQRQLDGFGGDDDGDAAFRGWVDDSVHGGLPKDGSTNDFRVELGGAIDEGSNSKCGG